MRVIRYEDIECFERAAINRVSSQRAMCLLGLFWDISEANILHAETGLLVLPGAQTNAPRGECKHAGGNYVPYSCHAALKFVCSCLTDRQKYYQADLRREREGCNRLRPLKGNVIEFIFKSNKLMRTYLLILFIAGMSPPPARVSFPF